MKGRSISPWLVPLGLFAFFLLIFFRDTIPALSKAERLREDRDRLYRENLSLQEEIQRYRIEKEQLQKSYFYNERIRRLHFQSGPESEGASKK